MQCQNCEKAAAVLNDHAENHLDYAANTLPDPLCLLHMLHELAAMPPTCKHEPYT